jgi:hypothetical protein
VEEECILAEIVIQETLWKDVVPLARRRHQKVAALVEQVLRDYVQQVADEELLARSARAARLVKFRMQESEEIVKRFRESRKIGKEIENN